MRRWAPAVAAAVLATALLLAAALPAAACPVCFGEAEGEVVEATQWSVAFLGALVYGLLGGAGALVLVQRRRLRRQSEQAADPHHGLRLVPGEGAAPASRPAARPATDPPSDPPSKPAVEE